MAASCELILNLFDIMTLIFDIDFHLVHCPFHRRREQHLAKEHQSEVDSLTADHLRETQKLLAEFNRAKELLKDKIDALQLM